MSVSDQFLLGFVQFGEFLTHLSDRISQVHQFPIGNVGILPQNILFELRDCCFHVFTTHLLSLRDGCDPFFKITQRFHHLIALRFNLRELRILLCWLSAFVHKVSQLLHRLQSKFLKGLLNAPDLFRNLRSQHVELCRLIGHLLHFIGDFLRELQRPVFDRRGFCQFLLQLLQLLLFRFGQLDRLWRSGRLSRIGFRFLLGFRFRLGRGRFNLVCQVSVFRFQFVRDCLDFGLLLNKLFEFVLQRFCLLLKLCELLIGSVAVFGHPDGVIQSRRTLAFGVPHFDAIAQRLIQLQSFFLQIQHNDSVLALLRPVIFSDRTALEAGGAWRQQR